MNRVSLDGDWELAWREPGQGQRQGLSKGLKIGRWIPARVPGEIHLDLLRAGLIPEPLYARNAEKQTWIEDKDWWFRKEFEAGSLQLAAGRTTLRFGGLDCTADIWLNGIQIGSANNALHAHDFEVSKALLSGQNVLVVRLDSGMFYSKSKDWKKYARRNESHREWIRKAQFSFKWDWAPRLLNVGIWRPVELQGVERARLRNVRLYGKLRMEKGKGKLATLEVDFGVENVTKETLRLDASAILLGQGAPPAKKAILKARPGLSRHRMALKVRNPRLWWPAGQGEPYLYEFALGLYEGENLLDNHVCEHGIRSVKLLREPLGEEGESFTLEINGRQVFLKGANWVPVDSILPRISPEKYRRLVDLALEANFNCFRIWGGGIYEDPEFWKACDRRGLMVWHDFMYACGMYPDDHKEFRDNIRAETRAVVREIRNHPSLVLWSGNNENQEGFRAQWLGKPGDPFFGTEIFYKIIPQVLKEEDPDRPWWPGSPVSTMLPPQSHGQAPRGNLKASLGNFPDAEEAGDRHSWHTLGSLPQAADYRLWAKDHGKMISEFGWLSEPSVETRDSYTPKNQRYVDSPTYKFHDNPFNGGRINAALEAYGRGLKVSDRERALHSQLIQGEALTYAISHFRRRMPVCSGTIFWMYSDCWGCPGWTIVDYDLRRKASFWSLKRVFEPRLLSFQEEGHGFNLWLTNELGPVQGRLEYGIMDWKGSRLPVPGGKPRKVSVRDNSSVCLARLPVLLRDWSWPDKAFVWAKLKFEDGSELRAHAFWRPPLQLKLPAAQLKVRTLFQRKEGPALRSRRLSNDGGAEVILEIFSETLALGVHFENPEVVEGGSNVLVSDNYFDLWPGETRRITISGKKISPRLRALNSR